MKRTSLILILVAFTSSILLSQYVMFPDQKFYSALIEKGYDLNGDHKISYAEAEAALIIDVSEEGIADLTGIEYFSNLEALICSENQLTSLDVSKNTALEYLDCRENHDGDWNGLTNLDVSNNTVLEHLDCSRNQLTSLNVSNNTALEHLDCNWNSLDSLDVSKNTALEYLDCSWNYGYDGSTLTLTNLDVSKNSALKYLNCWMNGLTSLDVSKNTALEYLDCGINEITSLDLSSNVALKYLYCRAQCIHLKSPLASLNVSGCTALEKLDCFNTSVSRLDLSNNIALKELCCSSSPISSLDLCHNDSIHKLEIDFMPNLDTVYVWESFPYAVNIESYGTIAEFIYCSSTGIDTHDPTGMSIYPNPTNDLLIIESDNPEQHSIEITSLNGQLLYTDRMEGPTHQIDLSSFEKGSYFITIRSGDLVRTQKIIKR